MDRLAAAWEARVKPDDTVIVAGDIDWALHLDQARETLARLHAWPGHKILVRGNHDYWWSSKTTNRVRAVLPEDIELLHNNSFLVQGFNVCGSKGSPVPGSLEWTDNDEKLLNRELIRLQTSLESRVPGFPTVVALHYPPFYPSSGTSRYKELLDRYEVTVCVYGHLHGEAASSGPHGTYDGVEYKLVAGDAVSFEPVAVGERQAPVYHGK